MGINFFSGRPLYLAFCLFFFSGAAIAAGGGDGFDNGGGLGEQRLAYAWSQAGTYLGICNTTNMCGISAIDRIRGIARGEHLERIRNDYELVVRNQEDFDFHEDGELRPLRTVQNFENRAKNAFVFNRSALYKEDLLGIEEPIAPEEAASLALSAFLLKLNIFDWFKFNTHRSAMTDAFAQDKIRLHLGAFDHPEVEIFIYEDSGLLLLSDGVNFLDLTDELRAALLNASRIQERCDVASIQNIYLNSPILSRLDSIRLLALKGQFLMRYKCDEEIKEYRFGNLVGIRLRFQWNREFKFLQFQELML